MATYELSERAVDDLESIYQWGAERFGLEQADRLAQRLELRLEQIAAHPTRWPLVQGLTPTYRRSVLGAHSIYYVRQDSEVLIVRILGRQDLLSALD